MFAAIVPRFGVGASAYPGSGIMEPQPNTSSENIRTTPSDPSPVEQLARQLLQCAQDDPTLLRRPPSTEAVEDHGAATAESPLVEAEEVPLPVAPLPA